MAMTPEAKVKARVRKLLDFEGVWYFAPQAGIYGAAGTPDFIGCIGGRFFAVECKAGKNVPTALQDKAMQKIRAAGGIAFWVNEEMVEAELMRRLMEEIK